MKLLEVKEVYRPHCLTYKLVMVLGESTNQFTDGAQSAARLGWASTGSPFAGPFGLDRVQVIN